MIAVSDPATIRDMRAERLSISLGKTGKRLHAIRKPYAYGGLHAISEPCTYRNCDANSNSCRNHNRNADGNTATDAHTQVWANSKAASQSRAPPIKSNG